ncbi:hypothetical protein [Methanolobus psychrotolerans]|uniref:hypothetical protein n=1 Tax=Methanolobus psychrotolerans TaxID=1874706 RepID=UPI000B91BDCD|nr:hypothetical protein [Methanolobus psychrotolerans]
MIRRIIFCLDYSFGERDYQRFGVETFERNGFSVEVWGLFSVFHSHDLETTWVNNKVLATRHFTSKCEVKSAIMELGQNDIVILLIPFRINSLFIYRTLSKMKIRYCLLAANSLPLLPLLRKNKFNVRKVLSAKPKHVLDQFFRHLPFKWLGVKSASLLLLGGTKSNFSTYPVDNTTDKLWLHALDYDLYLDQIKEPGVNENYGVFLDEYMPFHPDYSYSNISAPESAESYYEGICKIFRSIESKSGANIIIAAHPRSNYEQHSDYFNGRHIIKGNTLELVSKSSFVICHASTSVNFAVLFQKPVIFLTSDELNKSWYGLHIHSMAASFGKKPINVNLDVAIDLQKEFEVDSAAYMEYKSKYIKTSDSREAPFWEVFSDYLTENY